MGLPSKYLTSSRTPMHPPCDHDPAQHMMACHVCDYYAGLISLWDARQISMMQKGSACS